ncbi:unnamed protein product [Owenia fusiformis]|uniref:Uncharacterized protein n=1 Tax=Owenia fusiformis TaxID=6347 RepID=A0A8J1U5X0_OWEFU|nr:unnamed protein product [Owenia fusiformis]
MVNPFHLMPGPKVWPIFGCGLNYSKFGKYSFERLHLAKIDYYKRYGNIYRERLGPMWIVNLFSPDDMAKVFRAEGRYPNRPALPIVTAGHKHDGIRLGLGSLGGKEWHKLRTSITKIMMRPKAATLYLPAQNKVADDFVQFLKESRNEKMQIPDFYNQILKYTMESIGTVCFNTRLGTLSHDLKADSEAYKMVMGSAAMFDGVVRTTYAFPWYMLFRTKLYKQFKWGKETCEKIAQIYIDKTLERLKNTNDGNEAHESEVTFLTTLLESGKVSKEEALDITVDLFTAAIDSTASALSFAIYNLSKHPEKQEKLYQEIKDVVGDGGDVTADQLDKMHYLKACIKESFRLNFPIEGGTRRILEESLELGGYKVPKGTLIAMNAQTTCLMEEYFDKPFEYVPERWMKDGSAELNPPPAFTMMPFGYGPRMCVGRRFAEQEIYLALMKMVGHFKLGYTGKGIGMLNRVFTMPDSPLTVTFTER